MAKKSERTYNISVVGLSGSERDKGAVGVGKSCLCNRFIRPLADEYHTDHISLLSQTDFGGRVVNNDHFLYWGEVTKLDDGVDFVFQVVEQTEFMDDSLFQQFKSGKTDPYCKRCTGTKLQSAEKLMYICKDQLALEHEFMQKLMPDGKMTIDGFICVFDVSEVSNRTVEKQIEVVSYILSNLMKTKKPVLLALTKMDSAIDSHIAYAERMLAKKELKGNVVLIETSSHENVNVDQAFINLAHLVDKNKNRTKFVSFHEAWNWRQEQVVVAKSAYIGLLRHNVGDHRITWQVFHKKMACYSDFVHFIELCGTEAAKNIFKEHVSNLRRIYINAKERLFCERLQDLLEKLLPDMDTSGEKDWNAFKEFLLELADYSEYFLDMSLTESSSWEVIDLPDDRIPFNFLDSKMAEQLFESEVKRHDFKKKFWLLLDGHPAILPGKQLAEVSIQLMGRVSYDQLSERDRYEVYEKFQCVLKDKARHDFHELLFEFPKLFTDPAFSMQVTQEDLIDINAQLSDDARYQALNKMADDRKRMILQHLAFVHCPSRATCPFRSLCLDAVLEDALSCKTDRPQVWCRRWRVEDKTRQLNLVLLGGNGLCDDFLADIRHVCEGDEFCYDNATYSLDYRTIEGDVALPQNSLKVPDFSPDACICVYSSPQGLEYLKNSLEILILSDVSGQGDQRPFHGLPIAIVHTHQAGKSEYKLLQSEGHALAVRCHCPFLSFDEPVLDSGRTFQNCQILQAVQLVIQIGQLSHTFTESSSQPDIRLMMCFACGDQYHLPVAPITCHQLCHVSAGRAQIVRFITYLAESIRTVEIVLTSYHAAPFFLEETSQVYHGFIEVYAAKRKASFAALEQFICNIPCIPKLIVAITESVSANNSFSSYMRVLVNEGHEIATSYKAQFMISAISPTQQNEKFTSFLSHCVENKVESEDIYTDRRIPYYEASSSEESEPLYDSPKDPGDWNISPRFSDSDGEPMYSSSPPPCENGIYSEIPALTRPGACTSTPSSPTNGDSTTPKRLLKASTMPASVRLSQQEDGWIQNDLYALDAEFSPLIAPLPPPPPHTGPKRKLPPRPKMLPQKKYINMPEMIRKKPSCRQDSMKSDRQAPLATMDPIEISDYMTVKDGEHEENIYSLVQDALPRGTLHKVRSQAQSLSSNKPAPAPARKNKVRSNSPSEGSGEDEYLLRKKSLDAGKLSDPDEHLYEPVASRETMVSPTSYLINKKLDKQRRKEEKKRQKEMKQEEKKKEKNRRSKQHQRPVLTNLLSDMTLEDVSLSDQTGIPPFVEKCVHFIEATGLDTEGIYRVSGNKAHVDFLIDRWREDPHVDLEPYVESMKIPVTAVASALKGFFNNLSSPLIPSTLYDEINDSQAKLDAGIRLRSLKVILKKLPQTNLETLRFLVAHIAKVSEHQEVNSMDTRNLAIIWWPTLLRPEFVSMERMAMCHERFQEMVLNLIEHRSFLFADDAVHV